MKIEKIKLLNFTQSSLENPNARFNEEGVLKIGISSSFPNEYTSIIASPFSWMEATYRYTEIENKLYGQFPT